MSYIEFAEEIDEINRRIAALRSRIPEPELIEYAPGVKIEVRPAEDDCRVSVVAKGRGYTVVNYADDGLVVDVFDEPANEVHGFWALNSDLSGEDE